MNQNHMKKNAFNLSLAKQLADEVSREVSKRKKIAREAAAKVQVNNPQPSLVSQGLFQSA